MQIADEIVAVFPMVRTVFMIIFVGVLQNAVNRMKMKNSLLFGFLLYGMSHIILLVAPVKDLTLIIIGLFAVSVILILRVKAIGSYDEESNQ